MVDSFSSAKPYSFQVDGKPFTLPGLSFGDVDEVAEAMSGDVSQQLTAAKKILFSRANKGTEAAIKSLAIADLGTLFRKWAGVDASESDDSDES
jgi:hypothetical protein